MIHVLPDLGEGMKGHLGNGDALEDVPRIPAAHKTRLGPRRAAARVAKGCGGVLSHIS